MSSKQHDRFFHAMMSDMEVATDFFRQHLDDEFLQLLDLQSLSLQSESFIDASLCAHVVDVLYRVELRDGHGFVYLLVEHQSMAQKYMPLRLLQYVVKVMTYHVEDLGYSELPLVIPIVFYNGREPYRCSQTLFDLFQQTNQLHHRLFSQPFKLIDVNTINDEELLQPSWSHVFQFVMKHIFDYKDLESLQKVACLFSQLQIQESDKRVLTLLEYLLHRVDIKKRRSVKQRMFAILRQTLGDTTMTLAEMLREEGIEQGMKLGLEQGLERGLKQGENEALLKTAMRMLKLGCDADLVARVTELELNKIHDLSKS